MNGLSEICRQLPFCGWGNWSVWLSDWPAIMRLVLQSSCASAQRVRPPVTMTNIRQGPLGGSPPALTLRLPPSPLMCSSRGLPPCISLDESKFSKFHRCQLSSGRTSRNGSISFPFGPEKLKKKCRCSKDSGASSLSSWVAWSQVSYLLNRTGNNEGNLWFWPRTEGEKFSK